MAWRLFPSMWPVCNSVLDQSAERRNEAANIEASHELTRAEPRLDGEQRRCRSA